VRLHAKTPESASLFAKLKNHGTVPAHNMSVRMAVFLDSNGVAEEQMKQRITLFPADDIHFHVPIHHESLPAFTTTFSGSSAVQRLNVKVWIEYEGPGGRRYSMKTEHHKNVQDSGFMLDHSSSI
jgi:hypothetical protein